MRYRDVPMSVLLASETMRADVNQPVSAIGDRDSSFDRRSDLSPIDEGEPLGLLHGVPVAIKDLYDVAGVPTTYGSTVFAWTTSRRTTRSSSND